ncbi:hypothetical protein LOD99_14976 [Oopsacas minuta]|uniref:Transmembrane protein 209 n=1 Tax=Oopsacas minuta TaxID=111878 RepID=A0AAV7KF42_9METZ|nr:hypothetical protein LOD99_14976 [Oopsacas minuta]
MTRELGVPHHLLQEALAYQRNRTIANQSLYGFLLNASLVFLLSMDLYFLYTFKLLYQIEILWYIEFGLISIFTFNALTSLYAYSTPSKFVINKALSTTQMQLLGLDKSNVQIDDSISSEIPLSPVKTSTPEGSPTSQQLDSLHHSRSRSFTYFPSQHVNQEQLSTSFNQMNLSFTRSYNDEPITDMHSLENYLKSAENSAINNTSLSQSLFDHSNLSLSRSMDHSLTFPNTYQIATHLQNSNADDSQKIEAKVWSQLGIKRNELEIWTENCKLWISMTILHKIIDEIDHYNKILVDLGSPDYQIGLISMSMLRQLAINRQDQLTNLPLLIPYLSLHPNHDYLVNRIRELAKGSDISLYRWNSGGSYKGKKWDSSFPTDAQILIHLFCTYMDSMVPPTLSIADTQPFTSRFFSSAPQRFEDIQGVIAIYQTQILPPNFSILIKEKGLLTVPKGRLNLFHSIVAFLHYCYHKESGMLGQVNLSLLGLNLFTIIGK